jgi:hypothetical protein
MFILIKWFFDNFCLLYVKIFIKVLKLVLYSPLPTSFCLRQRRLAREKERFILPCQSSIIEDKDVGNGKIKQVDTQQMAKNVREPIKFCF